MNEYNKEKYKKDFPDTGTFNWKTVKLKTPDNPYYDGHKINGVLLHDGNFMTYGVLFLKDEFEIINENPFDDTVSHKSNMEKLYEDIKERMLELENGSQDELTQGRIQELSLIMIKIQQYLLEEFNLNNEI